jgi:hypothetical protein
VLASFFEIGEDVFNAVKVRRVFGQVEQVVGGLLDDFTGLRGFVKGRVVHDQGGVGGQLRGQAMLEPVVEPERVDGTLELDRRQ